MKSVFLLDIDTQKDFLLSSGALPLAGGERLIPKLRRLFDFARRNALTVISAVRALPADSAEPLPYPPHCIIGSDGQRKLEDTLLRRPLILEDRPVDINLVDAVRKHQQIVIQRREWDLFSNPVAEKLLRALPSHAIVFGVPLEHSVRFAAVGLRQRGVKAAVISDLVLPLEPRSGAAIHREMHRAGVESITLETLLTIYGA